MFGWSLLKELSQKWEECLVSFVRKSFLLTLAGFEPAIPWFVVRCLIHWATGPKKLEKNKKVTLTKSANLREILIKLSFCATGVRCMVARVARCKKTRKIGRKSQNPYSRSKLLICATSLYRLFLWFFHVESSILVPSGLHHWLVKTSDPARTRTWNPLIRSQMPYPLGHRT